MNKILLISISLLVLFVAAAGVSAAHAESTVDDNSTVVVDGDVDVVGIDSASSDVNVVDAAVDVNDSEVCPDANPVSHEDPVAVMDIAEVQNNADAIDSGNNGAANQDIHHFNRQSPDFIGGISKEKMDSLKGEIDKYTQHFKKNRYVQLTDDSNGPRYSVFEFILDVYKNHSYDDTVIIVSKALRNCGVYYFEIDVEDTMNEMRSGICNVNHNNFDADHYMKAINAIESYSDILSNALSLFP